MTTFAKFSMNGEAIGFVKPEDIPAYSEPPPRFSLRIHDCDLAAVQRIEGDGPIEPIKMQAGDRELFGFIEETSGGDVCSVRIRMVRSKE